MRRTHGGFTLVEILVALSVAALLVSLVYGAVRVGQRSARALGVQTEQAEVMRIGWQFLHNAIAQARPVADPARPGNRTGFQGTQESLDFIANMPAHVGIGGLMRIGLSTRMTPEGYQLVLTRGRLEQSVSSVSIETGEQAVLVDRLDGLQIAYFGRSEDDTIPAWQTAWDDPQALPNLVWISVKPAGTAAWPMLIASPLMGAQPLGENAQASEEAATAAPGAVVE